MHDATTLPSSDDLVLWAEDEGALDDSILLGWDGATATLTIGLRILEDNPSGDRRAAFRRETDRYLPFTLRAVREGKLDIVGELEANVAFEYGLAEEGELFGLELQFGDATLRALAAEWSVSHGDEVVVPVERWFNLEELTFHGQGPIGAGELRAAIAARGVESSFFGNWNGSGQAFGAAFVRGVATPLEVPDDEKLGAAWRVVPAGAEASDLSGLWISGQSSNGAAYVTVQRRAGTDRKLIVAVIEALASLPGIEWAASGSNLVEDQAMRAAWFDAGYENEG